MRVKQLNANSQDATYSNLFKIHEIYERWLISLTKVTSYTVLMNESTEELKFISFFYFSVPETWKSAIINKMNNIAYCAVVVS